MSNKPDISLIMSVYNGEEFLGETLDSILNQSFQNWELIVIDDCSKDSTPDILEAYKKQDKRVRVFTNSENLRLQKSLNKALSLAEGKYIARMDADDICLPNRFEKQFEFMENNPDTDLSSCRFFTLKDGKLTPICVGLRCGAEYVKAMLLVTNPILHPGVIAKAKVIKSLGYDAACTKTEDLELWVRMSYNGLKIAIQEDYLMLYRLHSNQITAVTESTQINEAARIEKEYYRRTLLELSDSDLDYLINGIYFRHKIDVKKFKKFYHKIKRANNKSKKFVPDALDYAMFEILAEYKRSNISKTDFLYALSAFSPVFLLKEFTDRKKRVKADKVKIEEARNTYGKKH